MTAAVAVAAMAYAVNLLPGMEPGSGSWWLTKIPFMVANAVLLILVVKRVAPIEQRALLGGVTRWRWGTASMLAFAAVLSASLKSWSSPNATVLVVGLTVTIAIWGGLLADRPTRRSAAR